MALIPTRKSLALCEKVNTSHFCRYSTGPDWGMVEGGGGG